jgi:hypothetical protein
MALVIVLFLIAIVAFAMYDYISPQLPKEYQLNKDGVANSQSQGRTGADPNTAAGLTPPSSTQHWLVSSDGTNSRLVRQFTSHIRGGARIFDAPVMYLSCYQGALYAWVDTRLHAASSAQDPGRVLVQVNALPAELWVRQEGQNLSATNPRELLDLMSKETPVHISMAFGEAPPQSLTLNTEGFATVAAALGTCAQ